MLRLTRSVHRPSARHCHSIYHTAHCAASIEYSRLTSLTSRNSPCDTLPTTPLTLHPAASTASVALPVVAEVVLAVRAVAVLGSCSRVRQLSPYN